MQFLFYLAQKELFQSILFSYELHGSDIHKRTIFITSYQLDPSGTPVPFSKSDLAVSSSEGGSDETTFSAFRFGSFGSKLAPTDKEFDAPGFTDGPTYHSK
jgi:hypothetical protein